MILIHLRVPLRRTRSMV